MLKSETIAPIANNSSEVQKLPEYLGLDLQNLSSLIKDIALGIDPSSEDFIINQSISRIITLAQILEKEAEAINHLIS